MNNHKPPLPPSWRRRLFERLFAYRVPVLVITLLVTILGIVAGAGIVWREDVMDLLPREDPLIAQYRQILEDFGQLNMLLVEIGPAPGAPTPAPPELSAAAGRVEDAMRRSGLFKQITGRMDASDFAAALDTLRARRASIFTAEDATSIAQRLAPEAIRAALAGWKRQLTETPAPYVARQFARDPLGLDQLLLNKLAAAQSFDGPIRLEQGRLFSRDLAHVLLMADPVHPSTDSFHSQALVDFMDAAARDIERAAPGRLRLAYLCGHRFSIENASRIKSDVKMTLLISFLAIGLVSLLVYRRPLWVGLTFLPTFFGGAFALGMLRWLVPDISAIAIGCGSMLLGVAVDLGIHLLYHIDQIDETRPRREQIIEILDRLFWPLMLCSSTTIVAFLALEWSVLPGYRSLGHFAVFGFTGATIFAICVLPLLVPLRGRPATRKPAFEAARLFPPLFAWIARHSRLILAALILSVPVCLPGLLRLRFEGDYKKMNAVSPRVQQDMDRINAVFGSAMPSTSIVLRGGSLPLWEQENVYAFLKQEQAKGTIEAVQSIAPLLPEWKTQEASLARWRQFWSPARVASLRAELNSAAADLRMAPGAFEPFLASLNPSPKQLVWPLELKDLQAGLLGQLMKMHAVQNTTGCAVLINITLAPKTDPEDLFSRIDNAMSWQIYWKKSGNLKLREKTISDPKYLYTSSFHTYFHAPLFMQHIISLIHREMLRVSAITIVLVVLILLFYYRAWRDLALILLPLLAGLFWTFAIMGWAGLRINLMNSLIVVFVFGVVVDYSLFLYTALGQARGPADAHLAHSSVGIAVSALTTMIGLGVLVVARHPALHSIGLTSLLGIGAGVLAVFLILPLAHPPRSG